MTPFKYLQPESVEEALALLAEHGDEAKLVAGGTGLVNLMKMNLVQPAVLIGLRALSPLNQVEISDGVRIGALTTLRTLEYSSMVGRAAPLLAQACAHVATIRVRTMATLGGAMAHADPHMDTPPALIASDAKIKVRSQRGERTIPTDAFFTGYFETVLAPDELIAEIEIPQQPAGSGTAFIKFLPTTFDDYATVSVAARITLDARGTIADARIALGAAGLTPIRATKLEAALQGLETDQKKIADASHLVLGAIDPISDIRGSSEYKRTMAVVHARKAILSAIRAAR